MKSNLYFLWIYGMLAASLAGPAWGQLESEDEGAETAREVFREDTDFPWYDRENDSLRRLDVQPAKDVKNRHSKWEAKPPGSVSDWVLELLRILGWCLLAVALSLVAYFLVRALLLAESMTVEIESGHRRSGADRGLVDRVGKLPFSLQVNRLDLLEEARRHFEASDYGRAIIYLYSYQLVQLDKRQFIRLVKGKTNRQYLREVRRQPGIYALLEKTMIAFEDVFFGHQVLERRRFVDCWSEMDEFHHHLEAAAP